jgi:hypothetical protein
VEITFSITSLSRNKDGKSRMVIAVCGVEEIFVHDACDLFDGYVDIPSADSMLSVEAYVVKTLFNLSLALQERGEKLGITPTEVLMLSPVEH